MCAAILLFNEKEKHVADDLVHRMVKRAVEMEGTVTGEHGVGMVKRDYLNHELGESTVDVMRKVRYSFMPTKNRSLFPSPRRTKFLLTRCVYLFSSSKRSTLCVC